MCRHRVRAQDLGDIGYVLRIEKFNSESSSEIYYVAKSVAGVSRVQAEWSFERRCVYVCSLMLTGTRVCGCICQCVTFSCVLMSASPLAAAGAVSFSLRSVQQKAVWLSGSAAQWQKEHHALVPQYRSQ